jgi:hypothetical protein
MLARYILAIAGAAFLILGLVRLSMSGRSHPQARTWILVGVIFTAISAWLWTQQ